MRLKSSLERLDQGRNNQVGLCTRGLRQSQWQGLGSITSANNYIYRLQAQQQQINLNYHFLNYLKLYYSAMQLKKIYIKDMFSWEQNLLSISNQNDHEAQYAVPKTIDSLVVVSPGRFIIQLDRTPIAHSHQEILSSILQQMGLEDQELNPPIQTVPDTINGNDLKFIFNQSKITLSGQISEFKASKDIGSVEGYRSVINDGNTIVHHFWDNHHHYILFHEIKY